MKKARFGALLTLISRAKYGFFVAAGCSIAAGLPSGNELKFRILRDWFSKTEGKPIPSRDAELENWFRRRVRFTEGHVSLEDITSSYSRIVGRPGLLHLIESIVDWDKTPTKAHTHLARLVKHRFIRTIITTNYDTLIEKALRKENTVKDVDVIITEDDLRQVKEGHAKLIKLHGCITQRESICITSQETSKLGPWKMDFLRACLRQNGMVFLGYSARDRDISTAIVDVVESSDVAHYKPFWVSKTLETEAKAILNRYGATRNYIEEDVESFLARVYAKIVEPGSPDFESMETLSKYLKYCTEISDPEKQKFAVRDYSWHLAEKGRFQEAIQLAELLSDREARSWILAGISVVAANSGKISEAQRIRTKIFDLGHEGWALRAICTSLAKLGRLEEAVKVCEEIVEFGNEDKPWASLEIATVAARFGNFRKAKEVAASIARGHYRQEAWLAITKAFADRGKVREAIDTMDRYISDKEFRAIASSSIQASEVLLCAKMHHKVKMLQSARRMEKGLSRNDTDWFSKAQILRETLKDLVKVGETEQALRIVESIVEKAHLDHRPDLVAPVYAAIAGGYFGKGNEISASEMIRKASTMALNDDSDFAHETICETAVTAAEFGLIEEGERLAWEIPNHYLVDKIYALSLISKNSSRESPILKELEKLKAKVS